MTSGINNNIPYCICLHICLIETAALSDFMLLDAVYKFPYLLTYILTIDAHW